ncbi:MAG: lipase family protein, partial [Actinomycetota bacterium]|nr:lipase family protein [Actinomycetota bacterium]
MRKRALFTAALSLAAAAFTGAAAQPATAASTSSCYWWFHTNESFFQTTSLGGTTAPGELAKCRAITLDTSKVPTGTAGYQVIYRSTNEWGSPIVVSGTVLVPPNGNANVISLASGTVGMRDKTDAGDSCAPSVGLPTGGAFVSGVAKANLDEGFTVAVTDYEGLRTPTPHPYLVGRSAGHAQLDMARAVKNIPALVDSHADSKVILTGYSQGGHSTLWAAQLEASYADDLDVVGAVAGASPVDGIATINKNDGGIGSSLMVYVISSYSTSYPELGLRNRLSTSGLSFVDNHVGECSVQNALNLSLAYRSWGNLWKTGQNPLNDPAFVARVTRNAPPVAKPTIPLYMFHGDG